MQDYRSEFVMDEATSSISLTVCQSGWQASEAGHSYGPMVRNYYVIHYIIKGKGAYEVDGHVFSLQKGNGFLILPGDNTFYRADDNDPWEYYWVGFQGNEAERLLRLAGLGRGNLVFTYTKDDTLEKHIADIYYASQDYEAREFAMIGYLYLFFSRMIKNTASIGPYHQLYLTRATEYIAENYRGPIAVEQIAAHIGIDRTYLYRIFRGMLDTSVKEYIDSFRLTKARDLLQSTALPVSEICAMVGIADSGNFSKKFRAAFGVSPSGFRKRIIED